jgi:uncharacterized coiled-coil protein SlyX
LGNDSTESSQATQAPLELSFTPQSDQTLRLKIAGPLDANADLKALLSGEQMNQILTGLAQTAGNAAPAMVEALKVTRRINTILSSQQRDIELLVENLRRLSENLTAITENAKANPSGVLFGEPPPKISPRGKTGASK